MADIRRLPMPTASLWEWQLQGACREHDPNMFFHPDNERGSARYRREIAAKRVCGRCPVMTQCREAALAVHEPYGVWGGMTETERAEAIARSGRRLAPAI